MGDAAGGDARLAVNGAAIFECGDKVHVRKSRRKDAAANGEHFAADADGFGEIAGDVGERGKKKIAEIVADQAAAGVKAVLEKAAEKSFIFRKGDHAIANVAGREDAVLAAQAAGAAAVIGDGDDGGEIGDGVLGAGVFVGAANDEFLEAAKKSGEAGAAAESDDAEGAGERFSIWSFVFSCGRSGLVSWCHLTEKNLTQRSQRRARAQSARRRKYRTGLRPATTRSRYKRQQRPLAGGAVFLRIEQLGEARVFLEESKIFVVARVIAIFRAQLDGDLQIGQGGIGFASEAIQRRERVVNMVGLGRGFAGFVETFAGIVPAADVHHGHAALIVFIGGVGILLLRGLHALLGDFHVHARAIGKFFAGTFQNFFKFLLGAGKFLLMKEGQSFIVDFELRLDAGINQLDTPTLGGRRRRESLLFL